MATYDQVAASPTTDAPRSVEIPATLTKGRLYFVDNLRATAIILVVLVHLALIYGGIGSDTVEERQPSFVVAFLFAWFSFLNQAYLMGLLFFISGYFAPRSLGAKSAAQFVKSRLLRLGIPLLLYDFLINPPIVYWRMTAVQGDPLSITAFLRNYFDYFTGIGTGPMWFISNLLIFNLLYLLWRLARPERAVHAAGNRPAPGKWAFVGLALFLTAVTYVTRIWFPIGWEHFLNLRLQYYPQYVTLFVLGIVAYKRQWLTAWPASLGKFLLRLGIVAALAFVTVLMVGSSDKIRGGTYWQSAYFAAWEAFVLVGLGFGLLLLFSRRFNQGGKWSHFLAANAYAVYIIHVPVIFLLGLALKEVLLPPLLKFGLAALIAVPLCFVLSHWGVRKLPFADRIL
jgi:glucans biosynthesis protein C